MLYFRKILNKRILRFISYCRHTDIDFSDLLQVWFGMKYLPLMQNCQKMPLSPKPKLPRKPCWKPGNNQTKPQPYPTHFDIKRTPLNQNIFTLGSRHFGTQTLRANARLRRFMQVLCHKIFTPDPNFKPYNVQIKPHFYPTHFDTKRTIPNQNQFTIRLCNNPSRVPSVLRIWLGGFRHKIFTPERNLP